MFLAFSLFSEPFCNSGISASAAKRLYSLVTRETVVHSHCTRRSKNLIERLLKQVSESNIAVMVLLPPYFRTWKQKQRQKAWSVYF